MDSNIKTSQMKKKMNESHFKELIKQSITNEWDKFEYFRTVCRKKKQTLADLLIAVDDEEYYRIPAVAATAFKKSKGLYRELNDFSQAGKFQVSSNTSGDPSYVYTNSDELDKVVDNYRLTFGIDGTTKAIAFSPTIRILDAISRSAGFAGYQSVARMKLALEATNLYYKEPLFTLDVDVLKTLLSKAVRGKVVLRRKYLDELIAVIWSAERNQEKINLGGIVLLLYPYLDQMREGQFSIGNDAFFTFAGGGYNGSKGSITGKRIDKREMVKRISAIFGIDRNAYSTNLKDIYAFTECPATNEGYWNEEIEDYLFETWHESRVYIVDPETEEPLKSGTGLLKFITPYSNGNPSAANVSLLQSDLATIRGLAPNSTVTHFSNITRMQNAGIEGCAYKASEVATI